MPTKHTKVKKIVLSVNSISHGVCIERILTKDGHVTAVDLHDENTGEAIFCEAVSRHYHGKYLPTPKPKKKCFIKKNIR
jgi:hypothetical protein